MDYSLIEGWKCLPSLQCEFCFPRFFSRVLPSFFSDKSAYFLFEGFLLHPPSPLPLSLSKYMFSLPTVLSHSFDANRMPRTDVFAVPTCKSVPLHGQLKPQLLIPWLSPNGPIQKVLKTAHRGLIIITYLLEKQPL